MNKVLTERPRTGAAIAYREIRAKNKATDYDDLPSREGMRTVYGWERKEFSDLLGPLRRFLRSCIGRKWDEVWSEICANLSTNTVDRHLRGHALSEVEQHCIIVDGEVMTTGRYSSGLRPPYGLYVDPIDRVIRESAVPAPYRRKRRDTIQIDGRTYEKDGNVLYPTTHGLPPRMVTDGREAAQIGGIWYWLEGEIVPPAKEVLYDAVTRTRAATRLPGRRYIATVIDSTAFDFVLGRYVKSGEFCRNEKKQMSRRDLRKYHLINR
jgi:hypothetical protein